jgi:site-specific DNA-methyltransferase (cytosine-N4-specific)
MDNLKHEQTVYINKVFYKDASNMVEIPNGSIDLIVTSPPYYNIKDYSKNGYQNNKHSISNNKDVGNTTSFNNYLNSLAKI